MPYMKLETSVARNRKFVKAGPGPSWLWVCGVAYCQDSLTDGFIATEAIDFLGVKSARHLVKHLVSAGLWDVVEGGWQVHDYLEHNRSAADVAVLKAARAAGGKLGGRPSVNLPVTLKVSNAKPSEQYAQTFPVAVSVAADVAVVERREEERDSALDGPPMDVWARELVNLYPSQGTCAAQLVEPPLFKALTEDSPGLTPVAAWEALKQRLESHKRSHQWRVKGMIPRLDRYLRDGAHLQVLPEAPVSTLVNDRTAGTLEAASVILRGKS